MGEEQKCPRCKRPLSAKAPLELCPECLMEAGFATGAVPESNEPTVRAPFTPPSLAELATLFPQLEIVELLGQGGMGAVYKARQIHLDRIVALKILPPGIGADAAFAERFTREAKALAHLNHPGIVTLYESGQTNGLYYFFMEYVDGVSLRHLLAGKKLSPREALAIVPQICDALQYAHDQGIVHRDIKPENILLDTQGRVKVADFGLAKLVKTENTPMPGNGGPTPSGDGAATSASEGTPDGYALTQPGTVMGTPRYMAPEQREHPTDVDHRADIYSLGVVFYEMLTGEVPVGKFQPPSKKAAMDARLDEVVMGALAKEPQERYQQASEVKADVENIAAIPVVDATEGAASEAAALPLDAAEPLPGLNTARKGARDPRRTAFIASLTTAFLLCTAFGIAWLVMTKPGPRPSLSGVAKSEPSATAEPLGQPPLMDMGNLELPPLPPLPDIYISDLPPLKFTSGYEQPHVNKTVGGTPLRVGGNTYERGLGTHAHGEAVFAIPAEARRFVAVVGLDDGIKGDQFGRGSVCFEVYGDVNDPGEMPVLLGKSPVLSPKTAWCWAFDLNLESRFARIQLIVSDAGDGMECDHANWVNAGFLKSAGSAASPTAVAATPGGTESPDGAKPSLPSLWGITSNLVLNIPPRDTNADNKQIDLTNYYNGDLTKNWHSFWEKGNDLRELPTGLQTMADTLFDVRGVIAVNAEGEKKGHLPPMVEGIRIGRKCEMVHFLHGAFNAAFSNLEQIGHYRVHFANGEQAVIPIVTGRDVLDWHNKVPAGSPLVVAWEGDNPKTRQHPGENRKIHLFKSTWENPSPDVEIQTIDLVSRRGAPAPFLVAITVE